MVLSCSYYGCTNRQKKKSKLKIDYLQKMKKKRKANANDNDENENENCNQLSVNVIGESDKKSCKSSSRSESRSSGSNPTLSPSRKQTTCTRSRSSQQNEESETNGESEESSSKTCNIEIPMDSDTDSADKSIQEPRISFHRFPKKAEKLRLWVVAVGRMGPDGKLWMPTPHSSICSDHFRPCDFKPSTDKRIRTVLKPTAVPIPVRSSGFNQMESQRMRKDGKVKKKSE